MPPEAAPQPPRYPYVHVSVAAQDAELLALELWELGATGIEERDPSTLRAPDAGALTLVASFTSERDAVAAIAALTPRFRATLQHVVGDDWKHAYKAYFKPTRVGARLVVRPSWEPYRATADDVVLTLDPGAAFGTGTHESTRLVLEALQEQLEPGMRVLDVGCGSGILAIACLLLGAERARAIDVDPEAVTVARENARINGVSERLHADATPIDALGERFPLVLANIESRVLVPLRDALAARVEPGGVLILSGLLAPEREPLLAAYCALEPLETRAQGEWIALVLRRPRDGR
ncbi:MAG: 50S ribosomal protein L11 methyltransferase [Polyangiales bacterium]